MLTEKEYLLICLAEECAEVQHSITKALRFGLQDIEPEQTSTNQARLNGEIIDLLAILHLLQPYGIISNLLLSKEYDAIVLDAIEQKEDKVKRFMIYSRDKCFTLK